MDRLIADNSVPLAAADVAPVTGTPQYATDGNPAAGVPATLFPAYQYNALQEELMSVLTAAGIAPDRTNFGQLLASLNALFSSGSGFYGSDIILDTGVANALVIALTPAATAYLPGFQFFAKVAAANTGATTVNVDGLGAKPIKNIDGSQLGAGQLVVGTIIELIYDGAEFVLLNGNTTAANIAALTPTLLSATGHEILPSGLIRQWSQVTIPTGNADVVTLPFAFPNAIIHVNCNDGGNTAHSCAWVSNGSKGSFFAYGINSLLSPPNYALTSFSYEAFGY